MEQKSPYICGPLTDLLPEEQESVKQLYVDLADACERILGVRGFVPHEHCDPVLHASLSSTEVDAVERPQVCERTSILIAVILAGSWGGGIEIEMANRSGVPVILLVPEGNRASRLLKGNPAIKAISFFSDSDDAVMQLDRILTEKFSTEKFWLNCA